ncbi:MAG: response regulator [Xanthomonadales bacterium]|nr:response regulator [Xanthomonadales bacterium]
MEREPVICIVDDDEAIRESVRLLLFADGLHCETYESADALLKDEAAVDFDCMLLDIRMPGTDGLELFSMLQEKRVPYPIIFITGHGDIPLAVAAIKHGAYDFLTKPFGTGELLERVRSGIAAHQRQRQEQQELQELFERLGSCTRRERDVMHLLADGLSNKGIADTLCISPRTVEIHRAHVMEKMSADSLPALVRMMAVLEKNGAFC